MRGKWQSVKTSKCEGLTSACFNTIVNKLNEIYPSLLQNQFYDQAISVKLQQPNVWDVN